MSANRFVIVTADGTRTAVRGREQPGWRRGDPLDLVDGSGAARWAITFDGQLKFDGVVVPDAGLFTEHEVVEFDRAEASAGRCDCGSKAAKRRAPRRRGRK